MALMLYAAKARKRAVSTQITGTHMAGTNGTITRTIVDSAGQRHEYEVSPMPAGEGFALMAELGALVGGTVGRGIALAMDMADGENSVADMNVSPDMIGQAAETFFVRLVDADATRLAHRLLKYTTRDGIGFDTENFKFDRAYRANYGELRDAIRAVLEVNYGSFFAGLLGGLNRAA